MPFDLDQWRDEVRQIVIDFARNPRETLAQAGVTSVYGFLLGSTIMPVVAAAAADPGGAIVALSGVVGGLGANLVANIVQQKYDAANTIAVAAEEAQQHDLAPAYEAIAKEVAVIPLAEQALAQAGQTAVLIQLRDELQRLGKAGQFAGADINIQQSGGINFGVGTNVGQMGDVIAGDKVGGDKVMGNKTVTHGPQIHGNISSGRDTNIGTTQTITNYASPSPLPTPAKPTSIDPGLRLWVEDPHGEALSTLTVNQEAVLRAGVADNDTTLPDLDLVLDVDGVGMEWPDDTRRKLTLRSGKPVRAVRWTLLPTQTGPLTLRVLVLVRGSLLQQLALTVACSDESQSGVLSSMSTPPAPPEASVPVGFTLTSAPALPTHTNALTLVIDQEREGYRLRLIEGGSVTACPLALTAHGLNDLLMSARKELLAIVATPENHAYKQRNLTIPQPLAEQTLVRLARLGTYLWQGLFAGPGSSTDSIALGEWLRVRSQASPLHITVTAAHVPFPWALLYDRDSQQAVTAEGFWGFRHVLAAVPTSGRTGPKAGDLALGTVEQLRALAALNLAIDKDPWVTPHAVIPAQRRVLADLGFSTDEATTEAALRDTLAAGTDVDLLYLYGHIASELPDSSPMKAQFAHVPSGVGGTRIVLTDNRNALTLRDLYVAAPLSRTPLLRSGPLVVLNACGSANLSPLTYDGLAPYLLDLGARAVVGTECDTPIFFGAAFGPALLTAIFRDRLSVGEALRATRRHFLDQHRNVLGLLYGLYGSADLAVAR